MDSAAMQNEHEKRQISLKKNWTIIMYEQIYNDLEVV